MTSNNIDSDDIIILEPLSPEKVRTQVKVEYFKRDGVTIRRVTTTSRRKEKKKPHIRYDYTDDDLVIVDAPSEPTGSSRLNKRTKKESPLSDTDRTKSEAVPATPDQEDKDTLRSQLLNSLRMSLPRVKNVTADKKLVSPMEGRECAALDVSAISKRRSPLRCSSELVPNTEMEISNLEQNPSDSNESFFSARSSSSTPFGTPSNPLGGIPVGATSVVPIASPDSASPGAAMGGTPVVDSASPASLRSPGAIGDSPSPYSASPSPGVSPALHRPPPSSVVSPAALVGNSRTENASASPGSLKAALYDTPMPLKAISKETRHQDTTSIAEKLPELQNTSVDSTLTPQVRSPETMPTPSSGLPGTSPQYPLNTPAADAPLSPLSLPNQYLYNVLEYPSAWTDFVLVYGQKDPLQLVESIEGVQTTDRCPGKVLILAVLGLVLAQDECQKLIGNASLPEHNKRRVSGLDSDESDTEARAPVSEVTTNPDVSHRSLRLLRRLGLSTAPSLMRGFPQLDVTTLHRSTEQPTDAYLVLQSKLDASRGSSKVLAPHDKKKRTKRSREAPWVTDIAAHMGNHTTVWALLLDGDRPFAAPKNTTTQATLGQFVSRKTFIDPHWLTAPAASLLRVLVGLWEEEEQLIAPYGGRMAHSLLTQLHRDRKTLSRVVGIIASPFSVLLSHTKNDSVLSEAYDRCKLSARLFSVITSVLRGSDAAVLSEFQTLVQTSSLIQTKDSRHLFVELLLDTGTETLARAASLAGFLRRIMSKTKGKWFEECIKWLRHKGLGDGILYSTVETLFGCQRIVADSDVEIEPLEEEIRDSYDGDIIADAFMRSIHATMNHAHVSHADELINMAFP